GEDITTGFNPQFLLDGLTAIDEPVVELAFTQASKPVVLSGAASDSGEDGASFRYLLMPRRLLS
ncbi:MAG: DNA polymerase III subunit beta, partial [Nocardioides sp.]